MLNSRENLRNDAFQSVVISDSGMAFQSQSGSNSNGGTICTSNGYYEPAEHNEVVSRQDSNQGSNGRNELAPFNVV